MENNNPVQSQGDEIDLIEVAKKIWAERKFILKVAAIFLIIGIIMAYGSPKEYRAEAKLLVESSSASVSGGLLQQFSGLAGISIGGGQESSSLSPEIYPEILKTNLFLIEVLKENVHTSQSDSAVCIYNYLNTEIKPSVMSIIMAYTIGLPGKIAGLFSKKTKIEFNLPDIDKEPLVLNGQQEGTIGTLKSRIKIETAETGILIISAEMPDPIAAAELVSIVQKYLSKYVIDYKIQKKKNELEFIQNQYIEVRKKYIETQERLASFRDQNRFISSASSKTEEERLQNEFTLAFNVYNVLAQQLEQTKLKLQEQTPVLKTIDPVKIPLSESKPRKTLIIMAMMFLGGFAGMGISIIKFIIRSQRQETI